MPFQCNYCGDYFCPEHRLPEEHRCVKLTLIRAKKFGQKKVYETVIPTKRASLNDFWDVSMDSCLERCGRAYPDI